MDLMRGNIVAVRTVVINSDVQALDVVFLNDGNVTEVRLQHTQK